MIFMKIKEFSLAMHHGKFEIERFSTEFQSIMAVSKLPYSYRKKNTKNEKNIFLR